MRAQYGLLSSLRAGARDSIPPTGLSSDNYAGMVFLGRRDVDVPLPPRHPPRTRRAGPEYRYRIRAAAADNAAKTGDP